MIRYVFGKNHVISKQEAGWRAINAHIFEDPIIPCWVTWKGILNHINCVNLWKIIIIVISRKCKSSKHCFYDILRRDHPWVSYDDTSCTVYFNSIWFFRSRSFLCLIEKKKCTIYDKRKDFFNTKIVLSILYSD